MKKNEATINRPQGDRILDAPFVSMNLDDYVKQVKSEDAWDKYDRNGITVFKTENATIVLTCLHKNARIGENSVDGIFQVQVLDGHLRITTDTGDSDLKDAGMAVFHPGVRHTIQAMKKSTLLMQTITLNGEAKDSQRRIENSL